MMLHLSDGFTFDGTEDKQHQNDLDQYAERTDKVAVVLDDGVANNAQHSNELIAVGSP